MAVLDFAGGELVPSAPLGWYFQKKISLNVNSLESFKYQIFCTLHLHFYPALGVNFHTSALPWVSICLSVMLRPTANQKYEKEARRSLTQKALSRIINQSVKAFRANQKPKNLALSLAKSDRLASFTPRAGYKNLDPRVEV